MHAHTVCICTPTHAHTHAHTVINVICQISPVRQVRNLENPLAPVSTSYLSPGSIAATFEMPLPPILSLSNPAAMISSDTQHLSLTCSHLSPTTGPFLNPFSALCFRVFFLKQKSDWATSSWLPCLQEKV